MGQEKRLTLEPQTADTTENREVASLSQTDKHIQIKRECFARESAEAGDRTCRSIPVSTTDLF